MKTARRLLHICVLLAASVCLGACASGGYEVKYAAYPPESKPHLKNWDYLMKVTTLAHGSMLENSPKTVRIEVVDAEGTTCLNEVFTAKLAAPEVQVDWSQFEQPRIRIMVPGDGEPLRYSIDRRDRIAIERNYAWSGTDARFELLDE